MYKTKEHLESPHLNAPLFYHNYEIKYQIFITEISGMLKSLI